MSIAKIRNLNKHYPAFHLKDISFSLEKGRITEKYSTKNTILKLRVH